MRTKGRVAAPPSTCANPSNMALRDIKSNAPTPSIDVTVADGFNSHNPWSAWAIHSHPARVDKTYWWGAVADLTASPNCCSGQILTHFEEELHGFAFVEQWAEVFARHPRGPPSDPSAGRTQFSPKLFLVQLKQCRRLETHNLKGHRLPWLVEGACVAHL